MLEKGSLKGKRILVTGGGTGLGKSMTQRFAELGANTVICGRRPEPLEATAQEIMKSTGTSCETYSCDVRNAESVQKMIEEIWAQGPINGLVNNAAGNFISRTEELSSRAMDAVLGIVLHGTAYVTLECGKRWLRDRTPATVLNIVTTYASTGSAFVVPSAMGKAGVLAMTRSLAVEWGPRGIRMNAIAPGPFPTPGAWERLVPLPKLSEKLVSQNPMRRVGEHIELANLASYLMSEFSGYINGEVVTIDGGEWLKGAGEFNFLEMLSDEEWKALRPPAKGAS